MSTVEPYRISIVGGAGHVGAPLAILLANRGQRTLIHDLDQNAMESLAQGRMPFFEQDAPTLLEQVLAAGTLGFSASAADCRGIPTIIVAIGTPIDEFRNPILSTMTDCLDSLLPHLDEGQLLILRSTIFPGVTEHVGRYLAHRGKQVLLAYCPERTVQGHTIEELQTLPQIVAGTTEEATRRAAEVCSSFAPSIVTMLPREAEFAKLISNAYRYIQFAAANQFYTLVEAEGLDYHRMLAGMKQDYPRLAGLPGPGFAAGPCLYKDTLQMAAYTEHNFGLGYAAIQVNEDLPAFLVGRLAREHRLEGMTVGVLGMAFKADSDDPRASLSYKLKKLLQLRARSVLTTDPLVKTDRELLPLEEVLERSDLLVVAVPHSAYRGLDLGAKPVLDVWGALTPATSATKSHR